jgi:ribosomal protein S6--L-glutamate ligase
VLTYWKRPGHPGGAITSLRLGAVIDHAWRPDLQQKGTALAVAIARKIHLDLAAIDFVFPMDDPSPEPRVLEINYFFGRRGLGGTSQYYVLLYDAVREWVRSHGLDPKSLTLA